MSSKKWVNGTVLRYHFLTQPGFAGSESQKNVVRKAFDIWAATGIGVKFREVDAIDEAEVRIAFDQVDGRSWSAVGRDVLNEPRNEPTMNFGWDLTRDPSELDTAIHEIGHTLGLPHEHQNPKAGIEWDEPAVIESLAGPPNFWPREDTIFNIIRKIRPDTIQGSNWDPDSVMHYPFEAGLILKPVEFRSGIQPKGGLSARDKEWIKSFYPPEMSETEIKVLESRPMTIKAGEQATFVFKPTVSRRYVIATHGESDTLLTLFEKPATGDPIFMAGDDDSGEDRNALIRARLVAGRTYLIRIRLFFALREGETAVMIQ